MSRFTIENGSLVYRDALGNTIQATITRDEARELSTKLIDYALNNPPAPPKPGEPGHVVLEAGGIDTARPDLTGPK